MPQKGCMLQLPTQKMKKACVYSVCMGSISLFLLLLMLTIKTQKNMENISKISIFFFKFLGHKVHCGKIKVITLTTHKYVCVFLFYHSPFSWSPKKQRFILCWCQNAVNATIETVKIEDSAINWRPHQQCRIKWLNAN